MKLTEAQLRNLESVRDHGQPTPRSKAAYNCRVNGWSEFVWLFEDGETATTTEKSPAEGCWLVKVVGEKITEAGRLALSSVREP
jgi:hypothetical protein